MSAPITDADRKVGIEIACAVLSDLGDRQGIGDELDQVDKEVRSEIYLAVGEIIAQALADAREAERATCVAWVRDAEGDGVADDLAAARASCR